MKGGEDSGGVERGLCRSIGRIKDDSPQRHGGHGEKTTKNSVISVSLWYNMRCVAGGQAFLTVAKGSVGELRTQLYIAREIGYLDEIEVKDLIERSKEISAMLAGLIKSLRSKM